MKKEALVHGGTLLATLALVYIGSAAFLSDMI